MKKLFILLAVAAMGFMAGCGDEYDDSALSGRIDSLEQRLSALETVMRAYESNLFILSVQESEEGYVINFSDGSVAIITNGKEGEKGERGETLIERIAVGTDEVTFVLTDGRIFSIALYADLSIVFDEGDLLSMPLNSSREIHYTVTSSLPDVEIEVLASADIRAKVVPATATEGVIEVHTGAEIDEYSKMIVLVSNGEKVIMRRFLFEESGLRVEDNTTKTLEPRGGELTLEYWSNAECEVIIPEAAQSWISLSPTTRTLAKHSVVLDIAVNTGDSRSANVTVQTPDGLMKATFRIVQKALPTEYYYSTDYSHDGEVIVLQKAVKGNGIDIVLLGDAYSDRQIADGTYMEVMEDMLEYLFYEEPFYTYQHLFNVYAVNVVSPTEGYDHGATALEGYFGEGTTVGGNNGTCMTYARKAVSDERMDETLIVVAMNRDVHAGTCYMYTASDNKGTYGSGTSVAYFPVRSYPAEFLQLLLHEACGHGFAKLADEYGQNGAITSYEAERRKEWQDVLGWFKNVDFTDDLSTIRWNYFLNDSRYNGERMGAFEGGLAYAKGVWRPKETSIMRYYTGGFNAPSREAIYYRIHKLAYGPNWVYDYEEFVEYDEVNRYWSGYTLNTFAPDEFKPTAPPVILEKSWRDEL